MFLLLILCVFLSSCTLETISNNTAKIIVLNMNPNKAENIKLTTTSLSYYHKDPIVYQFKDVEPGHYSDPKEIITFADVFPGGFAVTYTLTYSDNLDDYSVSNIVYAGMYGQNGIEYIDGSNILKLFKKPIVLSNLCFDNIKYKIGYSVAADNLSITNARIPDNYNGIKVITIKSNGFLSCGDLTNILIPNSIKTIGSRAFSGCSNLTTITIPESVERIESGSFMNCPKLSKVILKSEIPPVIPNVKVFQGCTSLSNMYVPKNGISNYLTNRIWGYFSNIIVLD